MHIRVGKLGIIGSDKGLSPGRRQVIIWTKEGIFLIRPLGTNFSDIFIAIHTFHSQNAFENVAWERRPFCPGLNVLTMDISLVYVQG